MKILVLMLAFVLACALWACFTVLWSMGEGIGWYVTVGQAFVLSALAAIAATACTLAGVFSFRGVNDATGAREASHTGE